MIEFFLQDGLSECEAKVVQLVLKGISNRQIGSLLFISEKTVKFHLTRVFKKINVNSRSELMARYMIPVYEHQQALSVVNG